MWRLFFLVAFIHVLEISTRPVDPLEGPLWSQAITDQDYIESNEPDSIPKTDSDNSYEESNEQDLNLNQRHQQFDRPTAANKRALSMFARWGPIGSFGKERVPIRSNLNVMPDGISAQTRSRIGQPLRWG